MLSLKYDLRFLGWPRHEHLRPCPHRWCCCLHSAMIHSANNWVFTVDTCLICLPLRSAHDSLFFTCKQIALFKCSLAQVRSAFAQDSPETSSLTQNPTQILSKARID